MEDCFEGFSENITDWETIRRMTELDLDDQPHKAPILDHRIHRFPRRDFSMYGLMPKMEQKIYTKCIDCGVVFNPLDVSFHKTCNGTITPTKSPILEKKNKGRSSGSRKSLNTFTLPPAKTSSPNRTTIKDRDSSSKTSKAVANQSVINSKVQEILSTVPETDIKGTSPNVPSPSCLSNDSLSLDGDSSSPIRMPSSRSSKKSRKAKSVKEYDPDVHCGVVDSNKGPCLRSITCSNHRIQLKKLVPGRRKDIQQLITEKRLAKERDLLNLSVPEIEKVGTERITEVLATPLEALNDVPSDLLDIKQDIADCMGGIEELRHEMKHSQDFIDVIHDSKTLDDFRYTSINSLSPSHQENCDKSFDFTELAPMSPLKEENSVTLDNYLHPISSQNQENLDYIPQFREDFNDGIAENPKYIQPMSPLKLESTPKPATFVSDSIVNIPLTDDTTVTYQIPDVELDGNIVRSHPKPVAIPNYGMKKFGGAILFNKPQFQLQRNDILRAVNDSRINFSLFDDMRLSRSKRNHCNLSLIEEDIEYKQMRLDPNLNHFLMQCEIRKPFDEVLLEECLQENFGRNTFTSTIDFE